VGAGVFEMAAQPVMQQGFLVSSSGGAHRVVINLRGWDFCWLLNAERSAEILGCYC